MRVRPAYHQIYLLDETESPPYPEQIDDADLDRRIKVIPFLLAIYTTSDEELEFDIKITPAQDGDDELRWDHIVEAPLAIPSGKLIIATPESYLPDAPRVTVAPGIYCARVAGRGLNANGREQYLVSLSPVASDSVTIIKYAGPYAA